MPNYIEVSGKVDADEFLNDLMDQYGDEAEPLAQWLGRFEKVEVVSTLDEDDAIAEISDERIKQDHRERNGGIEIEAEREFIDAIQCARKGDWNTARTLFGRMFQSDPYFAAEVDAAVTA